MKPNALRGAVAVLFLVAIAVAYLLGKGAGERQALAAGTAGGGDGARPSGSGGPLSALGTAAERRAAGAAGEINPDGSPKQANVKSVIAKARAKMQGGMMNASGMMRALAMLDEIGDEQIGEALAEVERSVKEPQQKMMFAMMLLSRWAEKDGAAALAYSEEHFSSKNPMMLAVKSSVVSSWAQSDPEAAWDWFEKQEKGAAGEPFGGRGMALMGIIGSLAAKDVDAAFDRLATISDQGERQMALQGLGQAVWDEDRRGQILAKIQGMEDTNEREQTRSAVVTQWAQIDPEGALEWAATLEDGERSAVVKQVGQSLAWSDPERSGELLLSEAKTPQERSQAYVSTISSWSYTDPNGAGEWLSNQQQGPDLDQARQQFASTVAQKDPESAMAWANAVTDASIREGAVQNVYMQWRGRDQAAADAALANSTLSPEKIAELQAMEIPSPQGQVLPGVRSFQTGGAGISTEQPVEATEEE